MSKLLITRKLAGTRPPADPVAVGLANLPGDLPPGVRRVVRTRGLRAAAVLVPLVERESGLTVLLTQRTEKLKKHPGQISFPGGRLEESDDGPVAAALRETEEEVGLSSALIDVAGFLDVYLTITGFAVVPVVGFVQPDFELRLDRHEVEDAFEVPLAFLMDVANHERHSRGFMGLKLHYYEINYDGRRIWGATAGMVRNLYEKLEV